MSQSNSVKFSVVMPVRNGADTVARQLQALAGQTLRQGWELIVVDNGSTDATVSVVESNAHRLPHLRVISAHGRAGINYARNCGVRAAAGEYIVLCDCDDRVDSRWLAEIDRAVDCGAVLFGGGLRISTKLGRPVGFESSKATLYGGGLGFLLWPTGANCGFRRDVFDRLGGFDESYRGGGDETDFFWRAQLAGIPLIAVPDAEIEYFQRDSVQEVFQQSRGYGQADVRLFRNFARAGMPRRLGVLSAAQLVKSTLLLAVRPRQIYRRARLASLLGITLGRIEQSWAERTLYI